MKKKVPALGMLVAMGKKMSEEIEKRFGAIYANIDNILKQLGEIKAEEGENIEIEDCRGVVDMLATEVEVLRRKVIYRYK